METTAQGLYVTYPIQFIECQVPNALVLAHLPCNKLINNVSWEPFLASKAGGGKVKGSATLPCMEVETEPFNVEIYILLRN